jgi:hypothetical protein
MDEAWYILDAEGELWGTWEMHANYTGLKCGVK